MAAQVGLSQSAVSRIWRALSTGAIENIRHLKCHPSFDQRGTSSPAPTLAGQQIS
jgi:hypothetical protein